MSILEAIDVKIDVERACAALRVPADQRAFIEAVYNGGLSPAAAGRELGWDGTRLAKVVKSLRADRAIGAGLRKQLAYYQKK